MVTVSDDKFTLKYTTTEKQTNKLNRIDVKFVVTSVLDQT